MGGCHLIIADSFTWPKVKLTLYKKTFNNSFRNPKLNGLCYPAFVLPVGLTVKEDCINKPHLTAGQYVQNVREDKGISLRKFADMIKKTLTLVSRFGRDDEISPSTVTLHSDGYRGGN